jgi:glutamate-1-semialdehyde 2,1-aminomutase
MQMVAPAGPVYQAGTLSGNPLAMAAGLAHLTALREPGVYARLEAMSARLAQGLVQAASEVGVPMHLTHVGSMFCAFFTTQPVVDEASAKTADTARFATFFHAMLARGVYLAPSQFETGFVSLAHTDEVIDVTIAAAQQALAALAADPTAAP